MEEHVLSGQGSNLQSLEPKSNVVPITLPDIVVEVTGVEPARYLRPKRSDLPIGLHLYVVDPKRFELSSSALQKQRSANWATGP